MNASNIDRIYAIWQTLFDDWFPHVTPPTVDESTTPLAPFHITQDRYFNSNDTKVWTEWGYQYDILVHQPGESQEHYIKRIKLYIEHTYPSNTGKVLRQDRGSLFDPTTVSKDQDIYNDYIIDVLYDR